MYLGIKARITHLEEEKWHYGREESVELDLFTAIW